MDRRKFLQKMMVMSAGGFAALSGNPFSPKIKLSHAAEGKSLVVLFQRGGCDGLNTCVPFGDANYYALRPTIAIPAPSDTDPTSAINLDGFFGLHPALQPLAPIFDSGELAILPTVHYPNGSRSHFDSQLYIESAARSRSIDGWLNRFLYVTPGSGEMRAVGFGSDLPHSLRGRVTVSSLQSISAFNLGIPDADSGTLLSNLSDVYDELSQDGRAYRDLLNRFGGRMVSDLNALRDIDATNYQPENGAVYPNNTTGRQLQQVAQLIKSGLGLEVATVSIGGWDTHSSQGGGELSGRQARAHSSFAGSIAAFYTDMGARMDDVVFLTCTEFGRTAAENGSAGTDHGYASTWFVLGGGVQGGIHGDWPGLEESQLRDGRYLDATVDYRDIFGDILTQHLQSNNLNLVLPGHSYTPLGLFG